VYNEARLRYFGGLSVEETVEVLGVFEITVKRCRRLAKAWPYGADLLIHSILENTL